MFIPSEFSLGGLTWTVKRMKRLKGRYGDCNLAKTTIQILDTIPEELKEQTFCHELVHAILVAMGKPTDEHNEEFTDAFAMFLHQYLKTAK
jgi:hypothetical protein